MTTTPRPAALTMTRRTGLVALLAGLGVAAAACGAETTTSGSGTGSGSSSAASATPTLSSYAATASTSTTTAQTISDTATAAQALLAVLSADQVATISHAYDDETKSTSWSNFPVTFVQRAGVDLVDLTAEQQAAAMAVVEALLSADGYATTTGIIAGDEYLLAESSTTEESLGQYYLAFFGEPSATGAWTLQLGGHHLGINATMDGTAGTLTFAPTHLGSQPAVWTDASGTTVQPLAGAYEDAFALFDSLTDEQRTAVYQGSEVSDLQSAPGDVSDYPTGTGLAGSALDAEQRSLLLAVVANWVGLSDEETTATALAAVEATLDDTWVSWSGATSYDMTQGSGIYYLVSGPRVYVELSCQQGSAGADVDGVTTAGWGHVHTIYRDPADDYAGSVTQEAATGTGAGGGPGGR